MSNYEQRRIGDLSHWDSEAAARYTVAKHGPDGRAFLDPVLYALLNQTRLEGKKFFDIGAGAGPWTAHALEQGVAHATALDLNPAMVEQARLKLSTKEVLDPRVTLYTANAANIPFLHEGQFDSLASVNVGCNMASITLDRHLYEAHRVAAVDAPFIVAAPNSLLVPFTTAEGGPPIQEFVDDAWARNQKEGSNKTPKQIIDELQYVLRATFILDKDGKPILITQENADRVESGDPVLRRIPGLVVDNNCHDVDEYMRSSEVAGWRIENLHEHSFEDEVERTTHNTRADAANQLGPEYVRNAPFLVLELKK